MGEIFDYVDELGPSKVIHVYEPTHNLKAVLVVDYVDFKLEGARLVVQGFGAVGKNSARFLAEKGAILVGVADSKGAISNPDGLDLDTLLTMKAERRSVMEYPEGQKLKRDAVIGIECDIWIPAARPDVVHGDNVDRLKTRLVVQGANIPFTYDAEKILHERGILSVPDFIANAGGVICGAMEYQQMNQSMAMQVIEEKIRANTMQILEQAKRKDIPPRDSALQLATERVKRAMATRRWSIF